MISPIARARACVWLCLHTRHISLGKRTRDTRIWTLPTRTPRPGADYTARTLPATLDVTNMTAAYTVEENASITLARAVIAELGRTVWVPEVTVEPTPGTTVWIIVTIAAQRMSVLLRWAALQFRLAIDERRDPLHRSGLQHRSDDLASLFSSPVKLGELAAAQAAERMAETIVYATKGIAWQRTGVHPDDLHFHCAQCGAIDFQATTGGVSTLVDYRCPSCRDPNRLSESSPSSAPAQHSPMARRRPRQNTHQTELIPLTELPTRAAPTTRDSGVPRWHVHRIIERIRRGGCAIGSGQQVLAVDKHLRETTASEQDTRIVITLLGAWIVRPDQLLHMGPTETIHLLRLTPTGERLTRRWDRLHGAPLAEHTDRD